MLPELATEASTALATLSMLFFVAVYAAVVVRVVKAKRHDLDAQARMALDDPPSPAASEGRLPNESSQDFAAPQGVR